MYQIAHQLPISASESVANALDRLRHAWRAHVIERHNLARLARRDLEDRGVTAGRFQFLQHHERRR